MDWKINCNNCLTTLQPFQDASTTSNDAGVVSHLTGYMTKCHHIFCGQCREKSYPNCIVCRQPTFWMEISLNMPKYFQMFFESTKKVVQLLNNVDGFNILQAKTINDSVINSNERSKNDEWLISKETHVLKERYQYLKDKIQINNLIYKQFKELKT